MVNAQGVTSLIEIKELASDGRCYSSGHQGICPSRDWRVCIASRMRIVENENLVLILQWFGGFDVYDGLNVLDNLGGLRVLISRCSTVSRCLTTVSKCSTVLICSTISRL